MRKWKIYVATLVLVFLLLPVLLIMFLEKGFPTVYVKQNGAYYSLVNDHLNYTLDANDNGVSQLKEYDIYDVQGGFSWLNGTTPTTALVGAYFNETYWDGTIAVGGVEATNGTDYARLEVVCVDLIWNASIVLTITLYEERYITYNSTLIYYNTTHPANSTTNYPAPIVSLSFMGQLNNDTGQTKIYGDRWANTQFPALVTEDVAAISGEAVCMHAWLVTNTTQTVGWFSCGRAEIKAFMEKYNTDLGGQFELWMLYPLEWFLYENGDIYTSPTAVLVLSPTDLDGALEQYNNFLYSQKIVNFNEDDLTTLFMSEKYGYNYDEDDVKVMIDTASSYGMGVVQLVHWMKDHGDWTVESWRFPNGISFLADYAHSKNVKLILWTEPAYVANDSAIALAHPEWLINETDGSLSVYKDPRYEESGGRYEWINEFKWSIEEPRDWITEVFYNYTVEGVDGFWIDFGGQDKFCRHPDAVYKNFEFTGLVVDSIYNNITDINPDATLMGWWLGQVPFSEHGMRMGDTLQAEISATSTHDIVNRIYWGRRLYGQTAIFGEYAHITSTTTAEEINYFYGFQLASGSSCFGVVSLAEDIERLPFNRYFTAHNIIKSLRAKTLTFDSRGIVTWYNDTRTIAMFANETVTRTINWDELDNNVNYYYMKNVTEDAAPVLLGSSSPSSITLKANASVVLYPAGSNEEAK